MTAILLLTQPECGLCDDAKAVLANLRAEFTIDVHEMSFDSADGRHLATRHGLLFAPGVLVDGKPFSYGRLSERKLRRTLARSHARS